MREIKIVFTNSGRSFRGTLFMPSKRTESVVIHAPGFGVDVHDMLGAGKIMKELASELTMYGVASLLFNYRYVSRGMGEFRKASLSSESSDLKVVIREMRKKFRKVGLLGESMGGIVVAKAYSKNADCIVFWYTPTAPKMDRMMRWDNYTKGKRGTYLGYKRAKGIYYIIGKKFAEERNNFKAGPAFSKIRCPSLILQGDADTRVSTADARKIFALVKGTRSLRILHGVEHAFRTRDGKAFAEGHVSKGLRITLAWFRRYLT